MRIGRWLGRGVGGFAAIAIVIGLALMAGRGGAGAHRQMLPEPVAVSAYPIPYFRRGDPAATRFGRLEYVGGLELRGAHPSFGGISAIRIAADGRRFLAVTDTGDWLRGAIAHRAGAPAALEDVVIAPILGVDGRRLRDSGLWDAESLAILGGEAFIGIEREHMLLRFAWQADGLRARGRPVALPEHVRRWPENRGIEALGVFPVGTAHSGRIVGLSERSGGPDAPTEGFVMDADGGRPFRFRLTRSDGFDITDLDFLPSGDLVVLERYFSPLRGVAMRLRRISSSDIRPDSTVDGEEIMRVDNAHQIDNMEGLSINRNAAGETILTLISDDNFSIAQRTLLLQFRWLGD